jgi:HNH endonuclease
VLVDLDSLQGHTGLGGDTDAGPLAPEACRRLACDGTLTRVLVSRHPSGHHGHEIPADDEVPSGHDVPTSHPGHDNLGSEGSLAARLRTAAALLPPVLGGTPSQPLELGRSSRVVSPTQRNALAVRDRGCVFPGCQRPLAWCEAHHLRHWLHGGPTDLTNLALVCRAHHRAVHEGGWRLARAPDGRLTATPPHRPHPRHPAAA